MISGFDFGTSNCAVAVQQSQKNIALLPIGAAHKTFIPSALYAQERELISEYVGLHISDADQKKTFINHRGNTLAQARKIREKMQSTAQEDSLLLGDEAFEQYFSLPDEGYFVKSPKSFLGASALRQDFVYFFEDIVTAMMQIIKQRAEHYLQQKLTHTVIGRPVNFQGLNAEHSNQQALSILTTSAQRAGFKSVEFLFEPLAAAMDFENSLHKEQIVLVVDIGGGTTDCSMVRMGPNKMQQTERQQDFLGHSGERVGGNDLDIAVAGSCLMPLFGLGSQLKNGLTAPKQPFLQAISTNDIAAQNKFYSLVSEQHIEQLCRDSCEPRLLQRFMHLREDRQNHHLVNSAEQGKIALSELMDSFIDLSYIEKDLGQSID